MRRGRSSGVKTGSGDHVLKPGAPPIVRGERLLIQAVRGRSIMCLHYETYMYV